MTGSRRDAHRWSERHGGVLIVPLEHAIRWLTWNSGGRLTPLAPSMGLLQVVPWPIRRPQRRRAMHIEYRRRRR